MVNCRFTIVIPNYNNAEWLDKMFESIYAQTYKNYNVTFVDDCSTDNSVEIAKKWAPKLGDFCLVKNKAKRWNGGSRNAGMRYATGQYTLFLDSDDWFIDATVLEEINKTIEANNCPDLVRLSYCSLIGDQLSLCDLSGQTTVGQIVSDPNVACWTKCIKTDKIVAFPEDTLMEDVVQHIAQMDKIETVAAIGRGVIVWNRNNTNSCSRDETLQNGKWKSSLYRYYADLLELIVTRPECQAELERRRAIVLDNIKNDRFVQ